MLQVIQAIQTEGFVNIFLHFVGMQETRRLKLEIKFLHKMYEHYMRVFEAYFLS